MENSDLDAFFAAARVAAPRPSAALLARIEADALVEQSRRARRARQARRPRQPAGHIRRILAALGGVPVAAGLASAMLAGAWIGLAQPALLAGLTDRLGGLAGTVTLDSVELIPALDPFATEG
jgi:anti-sigma factor RsiW